MVDLFRRRGMEYIGYAVVTWGKVSGSWYRRVELLARTM